MDTFEQVLKTHAFFKDMNQTHLMLLAEHAELVSYNTDQFIFHQNEVADRFYLITQGKVALEMTALSQGPLVIQTLSANEILGWSWLFPPYRWHFDARATEPTKAIAFDGKWLREQCKEDPELGNEFMQRIAQVLVQRLQATRLQLLDVYGIHS